MKVSERLGVIDRIGRELQARYSYDEIDAYLSAFGIQKPTNVGVNSKWVYSKRALADVDVGLLRQIVADLDLSPIPHSRPEGAPRNWAGRPEFRLFISHISADRDKATRLKDCLHAYAILGFVAHEDIHPTLEWQDEIERALGTMDAFVAVHTPGFAKSIWTQQEIGVAIGRGAKIISLRMGEDPTGFISKHQALSRQGRTAEAIARELDVLLKGDPLTAPKLLQAQAACSSRSARDDETPF